MQRKYLKVWMFISYKAEFLVRKHRNLFVKVDWSSDTLEGTKYMPYNSFRSADRTFPVLPPKTFFCLFISLIVALHYAQEYLRMYGRKGVRWSWTRSDRIGKRRVMTLYHLEMQINKYLFKLNIQCYLRVWAIPYKTASSVWFYIVKMINGVNEWMNDYCL